MIDSYITALCIHLKNEVPLNYFFKCPQYDFENENCVAKQKKQYNANCVCVCTFTHTYTHTYTYI